MKLTNRRIKEDRLMEGSDIIGLPPGARAKALLDRYGAAAASRAPVSTVFSDGEGVYLSDVDGNRYMDFADTTCIVGAKNARVTSAVRAVLDRSGVARCRPSEEQIELMETVQDICSPLLPDGRFYFANSGAHATECAMMLARSYGGRSMLISFAGGHYGSHLGSLALSAPRSAERRSVLPLIPGVVHAPYPYCYRCPLGQRYPECDLACLDYVRYMLATTAHPQEAAALFIEPIAQKCGVVPPPEGYLRGLKSLCEEHGILFVDNEVATGLGRTGRMFGIEHYDVQPDMVCLGKAFGNGLPMAGVLAREEIAAGSQARISGGTFSANRVCSASALATIREIQDRGLVDHAADVGEQMLRQLRELCEEYEMVGDVRGRGLFLGVELVEDRSSKAPAREKAKQVRAEALKRGLWLIVIGLYGNVVRLTPPLVLSTSQAEEAIGILEEAIREVEKKRGSGGG
jgi:4-aminobutyrate aminotransferase